MKVIEILTDILYYPTGPSKLISLSDLYINHDLLKIH